MGIPQARSQQEEPEELPCTIDAYHSLPFLPTKGKSCLCLIIFCAADFRTPALQLGQLVSQLFLTLPCSYLYSPFSFVRAMSWYSKLGPPWLEQGVVWFLQVTLAALCLYLTRENCVSLVTSVSSPQNSYSVVYQWCIAQLGNGYTFPEKTVIEKKKVIDFARHGILLPKITLHFLS